MKEIRIKSQIKFQTIQSYEFYSNINEKCHGGEKRAKNKRGGNFDKNILTETF